jgi:hypothetical protein
MPTVPKRPAARSAPAPRRARAPSPAQLAALPDDALLEAVQRQTFRFFWEGGHPVSGLAPDRLAGRKAAVDDKTAIGGSGFALMSIIVAVERAWITREAAVSRISAMLDILTRATCYHGAFPHFLNGRTAATIPFYRKDDAADLVETSFLCMGLLCVRQYFDADQPHEAQLRGRANGLWEDVEWNWFTQDQRRLLYWHWSPNNGWAVDLEIRGWNECLITYVLAAAAPRYGVAPLVYHRGFAGGREFVNGKAYYNITLPLGMPFGGPLFFSHYSFCALDPHALKDSYADYWQQNVAHARINHAHCSANPHGHPGYSGECWGLTASDDPDGYAVHDPAHDNGTISPTAALASLPYTPHESLAAIRHFLRRHGDKVWGRYGFVDAFCERRGWFADTFLAIDQGPIIIMIENHRSGLLWRLFMSVPEIQTGLRKLGFNFNTPRARS